eukprot:PITA_10437
MDITFANEKGVCLVVYLDDLTIFSNSDEEHLYHLKIIFQRCRKYGISLNPKKSLFAMDDDKLLSHIISKEGICIDPARVEAIQKIDFPRSKKEIQSFNGKMNFLRRFVPNLAEHLREIKNMPKLMAESNLHALDINLISSMSEEDEETSLAQVSEIFLLSPWYSENLSPSPGITKNKSRTLKWKAAKFCIMNNALYWKDPGGVLLNCLVEEEAKQVMEEFHKGVCEGRRKLQPLPLKPIEVSAPFQQWGLDFIGEIHPTSSVQHKWILTAIDYFTKWIEAIRTRQATNLVIISFLENNILSRFGCPNNLITNNAAAFKSKRMIEFCNKYQITLGHSTIYYPQGNGLAESSNKSLVNIIKKLLEKNKKSWHKKLVNALWVDRVSQKKSIGMSPFELMYGVDTVFPTSLAVLMVKLLQEEGNEDDHLQWRINQMIDLQQTREEVFQNTFKLQERIKKIYDKKEKVDKFQIEDIVLKWYARNEDKGKHGKSENLWKGPFKIATYRGKNAFLLKEMNG